jgi:hypothetical protein
LDILNNFKDKDSENAEGKWGRSRSTEPPINESFVIQTKLESAVKFVANERNWL